MLKKLDSFDILHTFLVMENGYNLEYVGANKETTSISDTGAGVLWICQNDKPIVALGIDYIIELVREERKRGQKDGRSIGYPPIS